MTDAEFVLSCLRRGGWWSLNALLRESFAVRGCGLTVHSRVSELRSRGHLVEHRMVGRRGDGSQYRLLTEGESAQVDNNDVGGSVVAASLARTGGETTRGQFLSAPSVSVPVQLALVPEENGAYRREAA